MSQTGDDRHGFWLRALIVVRGVQVALAERERFLNAQPAADTAARVAAGAQRQGRPAPRGRH
jgi:hypothetical protein